MNDYLDISRALIDLKMRGNFGLARHSWIRQLEAIRSWPTTEERS